MDENEQTLDKPRILCLHGAGLNDHVFKLQLRHIVRSLAPHFRLVFVNGPFESEAHPEVAVVYGDKGPFYRWFCWTSEHPVVQRETAVRLIEGCFQNAMRSDPGTGAWVGLLGFSQGGQLTASVLLENQLRQKMNATQGFAGVWWRFGVIMAGPSPIRSLSPVTSDNPYFHDSSSMILLAPQHDELGGFSERIQTPTLHVHGVNDEGLALHRRLYRVWCAPDSARLIEWNAGHRLPFKPSDVATVTKGILEIAMDADLCM